MKDLPVDEIQCVYRFALRLTHDHDTAEEIVQETFLRAWKGRTRLREAGARRVWLFRIAANVWRDGWRRSKSPVAQATPFADEGPAHTRSPDHLVSEQEQVVQILQAMDALPPRQRQVLYLFSVEGLAQGQIAQVLELSPEAVKAHLSLARKALRRRLAALEPST